MGRILLAAAGIVMAVLLAAFVPLSIASRGLHQSAVGTSAVLALALAAVGVVVARRQRRNPSAGSCWLAGSPVRQRVQHLVDRRFNRARYHAEQTVVAFAARLKEAADLDSVRDDLAGVVHRTLEPAHVSLWVSPPGS